MKKKSSKILNYIKVLSKKEKLALYLAVFIFSIGLVSWSIFYYFNATKKVPTVGGEYTEGIVGKPTYINPLLSRTNEVDGLISNLVFSSLLKYDENSILVNDLAEKYEISEDQKTYTIKIKKNVKWHDEQPLKASDVLFTVKLIQNPQFKSTLRGDWQDIEVETTDDYTIKFKLTEPYAPFLNKLTFGILPQHIFKDISSENFLINEFNLKPLGSGPFQFSDIKTDKQDNIISYQLIANKNYYDQVPYLEKINFNFYDSEGDLIEAYNKKEINGFGLQSYDKIQDFENNKDTQIKIIKAPVYFALFFNETKSVPLGETEVRKALSFAINKKEIIEKIFYQKAADPLHSPILENFGDIETSPEIEKYEYNPEKAKELLEKAGWEKDGEQWKKDNETLEISLISTQWSALVETSKLIQNYWEDLGVKVNISNLELSDIKNNYIMPREYQVILYGQEYFGNSPDPYYFWHSREKNYPGNNIAVFSTDELDKLLEEVRIDNNPEKIQENYNKIEKILADEMPAHYLYNVNYVYIINQKIKGFETQSIVSPIFKFSNINEWYIHTKRVRK
jgi:peptide/nickel transport system substrate-binding protein